MRRPASLLLLAGTIASAVALAAACSDAYSGAARGEPDADSPPPDASAIDTAAPPSDAGVEEDARPAPTAKVACNTATCNDQVCCQYKDDASVFCGASSDCRAQGEAPIACDDPTDCVSGVCCLRTLDSYHVGSATCSSDCDGGAFYAARACDPNRPGDCGSTLSCSRLLNTNLTFPFFVCQ